ncbi:MAG TPA: right-handed parallel beta-helix repeat-containing protein [Chthoniobacteraceae bacterium]|nr:right-handed parallel beta-helix repeat-containing protein [Chthoniobacteraceae bacterium]
MKSARTSSVIEPLEDRIAPSVFIVSTLADSGAGSLRQAILSANADTTTNAVDSIVFQKTPDVFLHGTIKLKSSLPAIDMAAGDSLTITGPTAGKPNGITINGGNHQIFSITGGAVTMTDMTVTHGLAPKGGGVYINDGAAIQLTDITITGNHAVATGSGAESLGGGVYISGASSNVTISNSLISKNLCIGPNATAADDAGYAFGGGILCRGTLTLNDSVVSGNVAQAGSAKTGNASLTAGGAYGGGIYASETNANVTIQHSTITGNKSIGGHGGNGAAKQSGGKGGYGNGGGVYSFEGTVLIANSTVSKNLAKSGSGGNGGSTASGGDSLDSWGGGVSSSGTDAGLTIQNSIISGNKTLTGKGGHKGSGSGGSNGYSGVTNGGGVYSKQLLSITQSTISGNSAEYGGGFFSYGGTSTLVGCTISKNKASDYGGGLATGNDATVTIQNSTVALNTSAVGGGFYSYGGTSTLIGCTISKNKASDYGGGLATGDDATLNIENSTVALNVSVVGGGGVAVNGSAVNVYNDTIALNKVTGSRGLGGGIDVLSGSSSTVNVISTILAGNIAKTGPDLSGSTSTVTASYDLIQHATTGTYTDGGNNITGENPLLGPLQINDGGTTDTMAPASDSPVIGHGSNPDSLSTDQNGNSRTGVDSLVDIGSVEVA